jgi:DNA adenine methylase
MTAYGLTPRAPFPWFGGKSRVAADVWARLGDTPNYVEPFFGSGAVLLARPQDHAAKIETVNDLDGFVANFWRAVSRDPAGTAKWADWPIIEADLNARHAYLVGRRESLLRRLEGDPEFYDEQIAGWWVAGVCGWIGSGYCSGEGPWSVVDGELVNRKMPHLGDAGRGINRKMPHLGDAGRGINRQMPHLGNAGQGINRQMPHLGDAGRGIEDWFAALAARLRRVRVCNGGWERVLSESVTIRHGMTGNSLLRIALCGYEGEGHDALLEHGWTAHAWKTAGGYGGGRGGTGDANRHKERIYFSPACIDLSEPDLFADFDDISTRELA